MERAGWEFNQCQVIPPVVVQDLTHQLRAKPNLLQYFLGSHGIIAWKSKAVPFSGGLNQDQPPLHGTSCRLFGTPMHLVLLTHKPGAMGNGRPSFNRFTPGGLWTSLTQQLQRTADARVTFVILPFQAFGFRQYEGWKRSEMRNRIQTPPKLHLARCFFLFHLVSISIL